MDFYHTPGSSSQATHIMLCEAGIEFRPHKVEIANHTLEDGSDYCQINPNGYVPALVFDDGVLLTETVAILDWLHCRASGRRSDNPSLRTLHLQLLAFLSTELHKPFIPLFFIVDEAERMRTIQILEARLRWIAGRVQGDYLLGDRFSGADAMLYVILRWSAMIEIDVPTRLNAFIEHVERRNCVGRVLASEGLRPLRNVK